MCGICGILKTSPTAYAIDDETLRSMASSMKHRGPDDAGTYLSDDRSVGFGFRRLSIIDLSAAGHQPMTNEDGSVYIVFNGEIYNHTELRKDLESRGHRYRSRTDTESILHGYEEYGIGILDKLHGMFSFAIWDARTRSLFCARDRIGIKPFYYSHRNGLFIFASEIKAILRHPSVHRQLNIDALPGYFCYRVVPPPDTLFSGIKKLMAGHYMILHEGETAEPVRWWDVIPEERSSVSPREYGPEIIRLLRQSIKDRMMSDVPFGVLLSGGIDSTTNVALMAELMDRPVETFSVGFSDHPQYNETDRAVAVARHFNTNHHEIYISGDELPSFLPVMAHHQDEPLADPVCVPLYFVCKLAKESGTTVVQVGEGSDEQFIGYHHYLREQRIHKYLWKPLRIPPSGFRRSLYRMLRNPLLRRGRYLPLEYIRKTAYESELFWGASITFTRTHQEEFLNDRIRHRLESLHETADRLHRIARERYPAASFLDKVIYLEFKQRLPELLLMRVDKMSMASSVEARVPFLDHRLVRFILSIPSSHKFTGRVPKRLLKEAVKGLVPDEIIKRKKQGFGAPVDEWFRGRTGDELESLISGSDIWKENLLERPFFDRLLTLHRSGTVNQGHQLWTLLNFAVWYDHWFHTIRSEVTP
jgi:asparagine synthase (glutamine-hydrolysing)